MAAKKSTKALMRRTKRAKKGKEMTQRHLYSLIPTTSGDSGVMLLDVPRGLSLMNRKLFEAGRNYRVRVTVIHSDEGGNAGHIMVGAAPNTWVTRNAYRLGKATFEAQQNAAGIARGKWSDFRPYYNQHHWAGSQGYLEGDWCTPSGVPIPYTALLTAPPQLQAQNGEWQRSQLYGTTTDDALLGDVANVALLGDSVGDPSAGWVAVGLVDEYGKMRTTVQSDSGETSADLSNSFFLTNQEASASLKINVNDFAQKPVYQGGFYYGSNGLDGVGQVLYDDLGVMCSLGGNTIEAGNGNRLIRTDWFDAPLGYIWLSTLDQGAQVESYFVLVEVAEGEYQGVKAPEL